MTAKCTGQLFTNLFGFVAIRFENTFYIYLIPVIFIDVLPLCAPLQLSKVMTKET